MMNFRLVARALAIIALAPLPGHAAARSEFSMAQVLHYPFTAELAAAEHGDVIAWVCNLDGVRNVWMARAPSFTPRKATQYSDDDGQEITQLTFSPDGARLVFVLGGDHDADGHDRRADFLPLEMHRLICLFRRSLRFIQFLG